MTRLIIQTKGKREERHLRMGAPLRIGRLDESAPATQRGLDADADDAALHDLQTLSREHARFSLAEDGGVTVTDLGSVNGTWLRLRPREAVALPAEFQILLGEEVLVRSQTQRLDGSIERCRTAEELAGHIHDALQRWVTAVSVISIDQLGEQRPPYRVYSLRSGRAIVVSWKGDTRRPWLDAWVRQCVTEFNCGGKRSTESTLPWRFLACSESRLKVRETAEKVAPAEDPVLITGESGAGKEVLARDIHCHSQCISGRFVAMNCANFSKDRVESELFGHEKGAFTGAYTSKLGQLELADNGTLFLDEVGELPLEVQAKLLRVLQFGEFQRVGGLRTHRVKFRLIAATNRNLEQMVHEGTFRKDLYYRIAVLPLHIPNPEPEDVAAFVSERLDEVQKKGTRQLSDVELAELPQLASKTDWIGHMREIENVLTRYLQLRKADASPRQNWEQALGRPCGPQQAPADDTPAPAEPLASILGLLPELTPKTKWPVFQNALCDLLFLQVAQAAVAESRKGVLTRLSTRLCVANAYPGQRLDGLDLETFPPSVSEISDKIDELRELLAPFLPFIQAALDLPPHR